MKRAKGPKGRADELFSQLVRSRGYCESCGRTENLQTAHILSRRYSLTRCDLDNALCLCAKCHLHYTGHPIEWADFIRNQWPGRYERVRDRAQGREKVDWKAVCDELRQLVGKEHEMGKMRNG